jgi:hypothetical protein
MREGPWSKLAPGFYADPDGTLHIFQKEIPHVTLEQLREAIRAALPGADMIEDDE